MMAAGYGTVDVLRYILDTLEDKELEREPASIILSKSPESEFDLILILFFYFSISFLQFTQVEGVYCFVTSERGILAVARQLFIMLLYTKSEFVSLSLSLSLSLCVCVCVCVCVFTNAIDVGLLQCCITQLHHVHTHVQKGQLETHFEA